MSVTGLDLSVYQAHTPNLAGKGFMFARATYGTSKDGMYDAHVAHARGQGVVTGAYHFGISMDGAAQARAFLAAAGKVDLYVLDLEADGNRARMSDAQVKAFIATVRGQGHKVGLYHSESGFPNLGQDYNWIAKWAPSPPSHPWHFWQYTSSGSVPGYAGRLDLDVFNGDLADLRRFVGQAAPPAPAPKSWWGSDVGADVQALDPNGARVLRAIKKTRTGIGTVINYIDLEVAMNKTGINYADATLPNGKPNPTAGYLAATKALLKWAGA